MLWKESTRGNYTMKIELGTLPLPSQGSVASLNIKIANVPAVVFLCVSPRMDEGILSRVPPCSCHSSLCLLIHVTHLRIQHLQFSTVFH